MTAPKRRLTHLDAKGRARMVDVGAKPATRRTATAEGRIRMEPATLALVASGGAPKGDVLAIARVAGIMAAKRTSEIVPLCHPLALTSVSVDFVLAHGEGHVLREKRAQAAHILAKATCATTGPTGVEMEALTAVSAALLTIYDMLKAVDRGMVVEHIMLTRKAGGRTGLWRRA